MAGRDTPPSVQDGPLGFEPDAVSNFDLDNKSSTGTVLDRSTAMKIGREIWEASTDWINSGRRARWNDSLRAFQNLHPSGSKYLSGDYRFRSSLFRPKTRTMIRRDEAATASAFFANEDVVSITAGDDDDPMQQASAEILKQLLQFRLANAEGEDRIPWFLILVGARQDADVMGLCIGKVGWEYEEKFVRTEMRPVMNQNGMPQWNDKLGMVDMESVDIFQKTKDHPYIGLISPENFRFEPGADWKDPVNSSPYVIEMSPVYINEALERMESQHGAPPEWDPVPVSALRGSTDLADDVTRRTRETGRIPGKDHDSWKPRDYDIAWTRLNILRWKGADWYYRTLASTGEIIEAPRPLSDVYLHGRRPYVVGCVNIETHKTYPSSKVELTTDLQRAANQDWNSRFDAVMLNLQPRQFVREGTGQDLHDLRTFMPGKVVLVSGPKDQPLNNQVTWDRPPPIDGASFQEQDRINLDWDDLTGAFTNSSQASSQISQQSATGMHLMSGEASGLNEYELRVFAETFVEPVLRLLIACEQAYETDEIVLALAGKKAQLFQRFGIDQVTNDLLQAGATVRVNVGIGASNPQMKLRNFATGAQILGNIFGPSAAMGANFPEVAKELFALLGYKDGERFFQPGFDPRVAMMQQQMAKQKGGGDTGQTRVQAAQIQAQSRIAERKIQQQTDMQMAQMDYQTKMDSEQADTDRMGMKLAHDSDRRREQMSHEHAMEETGFVRDQQKAQLDHQLDQRGAHLDHHREAAIVDRKAMHDYNLADQGAFHDSQLANQGAYHESQLADQTFDQQQSQTQLPAAPRQPSSAQPQMPGLTINTATSPEQTAMNQMLLQFLQASSQEQQMTAQTMSDSITQLAQTLQEGNSQLAYAISQIIVQQSQQAEQHNDQVNAALGQLADLTHNSATTSGAILQALNKKKKVVRGKDGRIEGVE